MVSKKKILKFNTNRFGFEKRRTWISWWKYDKKQQDIELNKKFKEEMLIIEDTM